MAGYSGKPLIQKLGIQPGFCIFIEGAPAAYGDIVGKLPADVTVAKRLKAPLDMVHLFVKQAAGLAGQLRGCGARYGAPAWTRRYQGLCDRRRLVRIEIRDPEGSTERQTPEMMFGLFCVYSISVTVGVDPGVIACSDGSESVAAL